MKFIFTLLLIVSTFFISYGQGSRKLTKSESANMTQEQRMVRESDRKSKSGKKKKKMSMKKRVKIDKKQDKKARSIKGPKPKSGNKRPK